MAKNFVSAVTTSGSAVTNVYSSSTSGEVVFEEDYSSTSSVPSWVTGSTGAIENGQLILSATGGDSNQQYSTIYKAQNGEQLKNFTIDTTYGLKSSTSGKYSVIYLKFSNGVYRQIVFRGTGGVIDEVGYNIYRDDALVATLGADSTSFNETISAGKYNYKVIPYNNAGESAEKATVVTGVSIFNQNPPAVPTNLIGSGGDSRLSLTWNASENATSYDVFVDGAFNSNITSTQAMISNLQNGRAYKIKVRGVSRKSHSDNNLCYP